jgi:hypothetical protein
MEYKKVIEANGEFRKVPLDPRVPTELCASARRQAKKNKRSY